MTHTGIVMRSTGSSYTVRDLQTGVAVECRVRGKLRLSGTRSTNPVAVGDTVDYQRGEGAEHGGAGDGIGVITTIHPRRNYIIRRASNLSKESHILAANIDQAVIVATLFRPETKPEFIDRFLVTCEAYKIPAVIVINKSDLLHDSEAREALEEFRRIYTSAGYPVLEVSGLKCENVEPLAELTHDKTTLFAGNSGVGKSTLIRCLDPEAGVRVAEISGAHNKGQHTTTYASMYPLPRGGYIIDTPGIKGFGLIDINPEELYQFFPEMMKYAGRCQYYNCTHTHEPGCAVEEALAAGDIAESRYVSYLKILEEDGKYR